MTLSFIPKVTMTATEEDILQAQLSHPTVKKYFMMLAWGMTEELLENTTPRKGEDAASFLASRQEVQGRLGAIESLLQIQAPANQPPSN